ncbi:DeoR/GlpR family DNA-binding transcription regulator [Streptomyces sp. XY332]|uniref:DeoR/GlpR family DNA-binding transcription regulator n=1 Tax=Streptomyces sp. XY332 TaxID=1415561 RepID=UPI0006B1EBBA|nr:DeoR/GlpR family DNA-binding transcription regulator [Streptomyces sp. XY332]KOY56939.1 alkaline phosphatase [Streptomyces sp. XY332]
MTRKERWQTLLDLLVERGELEVEPAAEALGVSAATIRRDLDQLAEQQLLVRTRGGAVVHGVSYELPLRYRTSRRAAEKQRISEAVAELIAPGEVIGLTGGTTTTEVARALAGRPDLATGSPALTVVTNALNIAGEAGGGPPTWPWPRGRSCRSRGSVPRASGAGPRTTWPRRVRAHHRGAGGGGGGAAPAPGGGGAPRHEDEAAMNRLLCERARRVVIAADSSKLAVRAFARICPTRSVDVLVTDTGLSDAVTAEFEASGVEVRRV